MDRYWLLTWTTYGSWLPGDDRGSVSPIRNAHGRPVRLNVPGTPATPPLPSLLVSVRNAMKSPPVRLSRDQANVLRTVFLEPANERGWTILAGAIMANHVHLVMGVTGDPDPAILLRDFKRYGSRALSQLVHVNRAGNWWTKSGSRRRLVREPNVIAAMEYVKNQHAPLTVWWLELDR